MEFTFDGRPTQVVGIDENGYGPILGPLVVTAVVLEVDGDPWDRLRLKHLDTRIRDSKEVFRGSLLTYRTGESLALSILREVSDPPRTFSSYLESLTGRPLTEHFSGCPALQSLHPDMPLPVWLPADVQPSLWRPVPGIRVLKILQRVIHPEEFNRRIQALQSKALLDFLTFLELVKAANPGPPDQDLLCLMGKIGGTTHYKKWFFMAGLPEVQTLRESRGWSRYRVGRWDLNFLMDADAQFLPVAMASILGKYTRELFMLSLSHGLGEGSPMPFASGYRHDSRTSQMIDLLVQHNVPVHCFLRVK